MISSNTGRYLIRLLLFHDQVKMIYHKTREVSEIYIQESNCTRRTSAQFVIDGFAFGRLT